MVTRIYRAVLCSMKHNRCTEAQHEPLPGGTNFCKSIVACRFVPTPSMTDLPRDITAKKLPIALKSERPPPKPDLPSPPSVKSPCPAPATTIRAAARWRNGSLPLSAAPTTASFASATPVGATIPLPPGRRLQQADPTAVHAPRPTHVATAQRASSHASQASGTPDTGYLTRDPVSDGPHATGRTHLLAPPTAVGVGGAGVARDSCLRPRHLIWPARLDLSSRPQSRSRPRFNGSTPTLAEITAAARRFPSFPHLSPSISFRALTDRSDESHGHGGRGEEARLRSAANLAPLPPRLLVERAAVHRRELRRGGGQPASPRRDGAAAQVHVHLQGAALRRGRGAHPRAGGLRHLRRHRRGERRHPFPCRRPGRGVPLDRRQRAPVRAGHGHLRRGRGQRGARVRGRVPGRGAAAGDAEPPRRRGGRGRRRGGGQVLHRQHHGRDGAVGAAVVGRVPPGRHAAAAGDPGVPEPHRRALHDQPVPVVRVPVGPEAGHAGLLPVPAQRRALRRRVEDQVHQHVRRAAGRREGRHDARRVRRRGRRGGGDRVADEGRRRGARRHAGERQGLRVGPGGAPAVRRGNAADAREGRGDVPVRAVRRGPQAWPRVGARVRAVPHGPQRGVRRRADVSGGRGGREPERGRRRRGGEGERRVVRGAGRRGGRGPAGGPGLRVRAGGRGLRRHPARGRLLRAQHGARPRGVRHEPALPGGGAKPVELRLPGVRHAHLQQPQLRRVRVHRGRPMIEGTAMLTPTSTSWQAIRSVLFSEDHDD